MENLSLEKLLEEEVEVKKETVISLCKSVLGYFKELPNVMVIDKIPPKGICVVGDIHGNAGDLVAVIKTFGIEEGSTFLFLGDFIDRGSQSLRVLFIVFCMILEKKLQVYCLRGNHETEKIARAYGLLEECKDEYALDAEEVFMELMNVLKYLPLACVVNKKYFLVHGGLSPGFQRIRELEKIERGTPELTDKPLGKDGYYKIDPIPLVDLLWSDPDDNVTGFQKSERQSGFLWGPDATKKFLKDNRLKMVIRSHEYCEFGYKRNHNDQVLTIFSSSNYCNSHNAAVYGLISKSGVEICMFGELLDD